MIATISTQICCIQYFCTISMIASQFKIFPPSLYLDPRTSAIIVGCTLNPNSIFAVVHQALFPHSSIIIIYSSFQVFNHDLRLYACTIFIAVELAIGIRSAAMSYMQIPRSSKPLYYACIGCERNAFAALTFADGFCERKIQCCAKSRGSGSTEQQCVRIITINTRQV